MELEIGIAGWVLSGEILREKTMTLLEFPGVCASHGVKTVELCSTFFESQDARYLNELRGILEDNGLSVRNIAGADASVRRTDIEALKQWFYTASAVGSEAIRINTGHADDDGAMDRVIEGYRELAEVGQQAGVKLLVENHGGVSSTSENLARILSGVDTPWFATCPDTGNFPGGDWEDGMRVLASRAFSCHVKAFNYDTEGKQAWEDRDGNHREYDLKRCLEILKNAGYTGPLCIERGASETTEDSIRDTLSYLKELMQGV
ncbi:MAG: sugar phosphate isomerase/epimerase family protein [Candidatus Latescibacteria bacterium]|jgi:sugar phosphate isomerase/epimerase|nr:sugar phosphate isomerase/epimerase family protein [Candidatus Latescibacterota bacterium]